MIDLHSHILYGIDDGSKSFDESLEILKKAYLGGVTEIVVTPHYIKDSKYKANNEDKMLLLGKLENELGKQGLSIRLYLGNEVFIDEGLPSLIGSDISTINGSKYMLMELPMGGKSLVLDEVLDELDEAGIVPIIAHPERYLSYYKNYDFFYDLKKRGCFLQGNVGSLFGYYGRKSKKMIRELLKRDLIDFFGSDIHHPYQEFYEYDVKRELKKIVKNDRIIEDILNCNARKILNNDDL